MLSATHCNTVSAWKVRLLRQVMLTTFRGPAWLKARALAIYTRLQTDPTPNEPFYMLLTTFQDPLIRATPNRPQMDVLISLYRALTKMLPNLDREAEERYLKPMCWFAFVSLFRSTTTTFGPALSLLSNVLVKLSSRGDFQEDMLRTLFDIRQEMEEPIARLEAVEKLRFESDSTFSITLGYCLFKGICHTALQSGTKEILEQLVDLTIQCTAEAEEWFGLTSERPMRKEVVGYFIPLLLFVSSWEEYAALVRRVNGGESHALRRSGEGEIPVVRVELIGHMEMETALALVSFVCVILKGNYANESQAVMLYSLLAELSSVYPDVVAAWCVHFIIFSSEL
jgi:hypothetical protein